MVKYTKKGKAGFKEMLDSLIKSKESLLSRLNEEIQTIGGGTLNVTSKAGKRYYIEYKNGRQKGISRNLGLVYELARKEYLVKRAAVIEKELKILAKNELQIELCEITEAKLEETMAEKYSSLDFERIIYSEIEQDWYRNRKSQNPYMRENLIYATESGNLMRSKSERFIGDFLEKKRMMYRYEPKISIEGRDIYPDFMVLKPNGEIVIWEHLGLMNNAEYADRMMRKLQDYRRNGFVQHRNLICTYEEDLRNKEVLENIFYRFLQG